RHAIERRACTCRHILAHMVREGLAGLAVECGIRECRVPAPSAICFHVDGLGGNGWTIVRVITSSNNHLELAVLI
ncbi:hypothetical protein LIY54_26595, partial [Escherichia coli]|nr:hypothetical protein [Escherichia coli]